VDSFRAAVERHFRVYDEREEHYGGELGASIFYVMGDASQFGEKIDSLTKDIHQSNPDLLVFMRRDGGEDLVFVTERPPVKDSKTRLNGILFALTLVTTAMAGASLWKGFSNPEQGMDWSQFWNLEYLLMGGLTFALPLMAILGIHEMGHYLTARKHGLRSSLPFFIPIPPTIMPFGTFGAFIRLKDPIPNRKVLFDVGISGPIAGFIIAVPLLIIGASLTASGAHELPDLYEVEITGPVTLLADEFGRLEYVGTATGDQFVTITTGQELSYTMTLDVKSPSGDVSDTSTGKITDSIPVPLFIPDDATEWVLTFEWDTGFVTFGDPLLVTLLKPIFPDQDYLSHPTYIAAWVGLLITGLNLLPIGQLDGGHVARAVFGEKARFVNRLALVFLLYLVFAFSSWLFLVLFVLLTGMYHPPPLSDHQKLGNGRIAIGIIGLVILVLTFVLVPIQL
jgi:membrane-associated protease RseP (regulator of RpoE activity)